MIEISRRAIIIAGPNGAGKTTFAREFLPVEAQCPVFVNADLIAAGLSPFAPEVAAIKGASCWRKLTTTLHIAAALRWKLLCLDELM